MKIFWTDIAFYQLQDIFDYYKVKANIRTARKITTKLIDCSLSLENNPKLGRIEELLQGRKEEFRFLVDGNYKIVYWIDEEQNLIFIASVFDCRQNPEKLKTL